MTITFHCKYCSKKIDASEKVAGKWGKCPSCHNKVYVPSLNADDDDDIQLAPMDKGEEEKKRKLMAETFAISQDILDEKEVPNEQGPAINTSQVDGKSLKGDIVSYLRLMVDGDLDRAAAISTTISQSGDQAMQILDEIALSDIGEPELADIPQNVLSGFIRDLRAKI